MRPRWILKGFGMLILGALFVAAFGWATMRLWNWLVPELFKGPTIDIAQAFGLLLLTRLLFGFGFRRGGGGPRGYIHGRMRERWRAKMEAKWATLSPEERDKNAKLFDAIVATGAGKNLTVLNRVKLQGVMAQKVEALY